MRRRWAAAVLAVFLGAAPLTAAPAASAAAGRSLAEPVGYASHRADACTDSAGVTVVVDFAELGGGVIVACASGLSARSHGSDALAAAGISWSPPTSQPGFVCRLAGRPSADESFGTAEQDDFRETCVDTPPPDAYWSYWQSSGDGNWTYSDSGLTATRVKPGGFEGWSFSTGALFPPDYNPVGGAGDPEPLPQPEPQPVPQPQPQPQPEPEPEPQPQPQPEQPAAPEPQVAPPAAEQPQPAQTSSVAQQEPTTVESTIPAAPTQAGTESSASTTSSSTVTAGSSSTSAPTSVGVSALADPVADSGGGGGGWVLGGVALIAALVGASFVVVRHRRHG